MTETQTMNASFFSLEAKAVPLIAAADAWRGLSTDLYSALESRLDAVKPIVDDWEGGDSESWQRHHDKYVIDLDALQAECEAVGTTVDDLSGAITSHQSQLNSLLTDIIGTLEAQWTTEGLVVTLETESDRTTHGNFVRDGRDIHDSFIEAVQEVKGDFEGHLAVIDDIAGRWRWVDSEHFNQVFDTPEEADDAGWMLVDGTWIFNAADGDNKVVVQRNMLGRMVVVCDGREFPVPPGADITLRTGDGDDEISVPFDTSVQVDILSGSGADSVNVGPEGGSRGMDTQVIGGQGDDTINVSGGQNYVSGGAGDDSIETHGNDQIRAGSGDDIVYALGHGNVISAGEGDDYVEGGRADSFIHAGSGSDTVSGGTGDDTVITGDGSNVVYAGHGDDRVIAGSDPSAEDSTVYAESGDEVHGGETVTIEVTDPPEWIRLDGSPEFIERTRADLAMYGTSPTGQDMLSELGDHRGALTTLTIQEAPLEGHTNAHLDSHINVQPGSVIEGTPTPTSVTLVHEMAHAYGDWSGNSSDGVLGPGEGAVVKTANGPDYPDVGVRESEYQATGLEFDHDNDPSTDDQIDPDFEGLSDNAIREEMGRPERTRYRQ